MVLEHILDSYNCAIEYEGMNIKIDRFTRTVVEKGILAPMHVHEMGEIHYVVKGKIKVIIDDKEFEAKEGDIYYAPPHVKHAEYIESEDFTELYGIEFKIDFSDADSSDAEIKEVKKIVNKTYKQCFADDKGIIKILGNIKKENEEKKFGYVLRIKVMVLDCILRTVQIISNNKRLNSNNNSKNLNEKRMLNIKNYIDINLVNNINMKDICKYAFISEKHLNRLFYEQYGSTVNQYMQNKRFELAKERLVSSDDSIENIALSVGFSSYQQMYRVFERKIQISPKDYRANNREKNSD